MARGTEFTSVARVPVGGETEEGSDLGGRLNTDPEERIGPRSKASKSSDSIVAAGMPVSGREATARGHRPATESGRLRDGRNP